MRGVARCLPTVFTSDSKNSDLKWKRNGIAAVDHREQERLAVAGVRVSGRRTGSTSTDELDEVAADGELRPYPCALLAGDFTSTAVGAMTTESRVLFQPEDRWKQV